MSKRPSTAGRLNSSPPSPEGGRCNHDCALKKFDEIERFMTRLLILLFTIGLLASCVRPSTDSTGTRPFYSPGTFGHDLEKLRVHHEDLVLLGDSLGAQVLIAPAYQGRVMTSTSGGHAGRSNGWINHTLIASGILQPHMNAFGGEERFWLGPEGGQFGLYFPPGSGFTFDQWQVPAMLDTEPFKTVKKNDQEAVFERDAELVNHSGTRFNVHIQRTVRMLDRTTAGMLLGIALPDTLPMVAFETENVLVNTGTDRWKKETGLLSIWILSMLNASPTGMVGIPYVGGDEKSLGPVVTDDYFGKVPSDRLAVTDSLILFRADAGFRSKIGLSPKRATDRMFGYDPVTGDITIALYSTPDPRAGYVNSKWENQSRPFAGDAVNAYNDGPNDTGSQMGSFYELESSSPAAALKPGDSI